MEQDLIRHQKTFSKWFIKGKLSYVEEQSTAGNLVVLSVFSFKGHIRELGRMGIHFRSTRPEVFCKKGVLRNFAKFAGKHLYQRLFSNKVASLACKFVKKEPLAQVFSCQFCEISQNNFFYRTPHVAASKIIVFKKIRASLTNLTFLVSRFKFCSS